MATHFLLYKEETQQGDIKMNVKINQKTYKVPELTMEHYVKMEEQGFSILEAFQKRQTMLVAMGFTCAVVGCDKEEAERLLTQHVRGGGNIVDIVKAFNEAVTSSDFFTAMFGAKKEEEAIQDQETNSQDLEIQEAKKKESE